MLAVMIGVCWDSIGIVLAPKWVLRNALITAFQQVQNRFSDHPLKIILEMLGEDGRFTADLDFSVEDAENSITNGQLLLNVDLPRKQLQGEGTLGTKGKELDLMLYFDPSIMVIQRDRSRNGMAYGIRYDRFSEDIRMIPLLSVLVDDSVFSGWEKKIMQAKNLTDIEFSAPQLPRISDETTKNLLMGVLLLPCSVERLPCPKNSGTCYQIYYQITPESLEKVWDGLDGTWDISFLLCKNRLVQVDVAAEKGASKKVFRFTLAENAEEGLMGIQLLSEEQGARREGSVYAVTKIGENHISESLEIYNDFDSEDLQNAFSYTWYPETGDLQLFNVAPEPVSLFFRMDENGICLQSEDWESILPGLYPKWSNRLNGKTIRGSVTVRRGESIQVPECKYPDQWSLEELLYLLADVKPFL